MSTCRLAARALYSELRGALSSSHQQSARRCCVLRWRQRLQRDQHAEFRSNYSNTVGIGLRYSTPIGPIRIDVGRNLNPVPGISVMQYYITLGQAF